MFAALALSLRQLADPRVIAILLKSLGITLALFAVLGTAGWFAIDAGLAALGFAGDPDGTARGLAALVAVLVGGWLLWRILALAVLQFFGDEYVRAVEARYYPQALAHARSLGWRSEARVALRGMRRAIGYNLLALPVALLLLVTGVGTVIVFVAVNAVLLGRELTEMVGLRHAPSPDAALPIGAGTRFAFGAVIAVLFSIPFANFLAPFIGAAGAAHLIHRSGAIDHAN